MISFFEIVLRLMLAVVLGGFIGLEREFHEQRAGMRTNALVSLGSALFTVISAYGFLDILTLTHTQIDPTRIASYIVAGIGFLGAGTIGIRKTGAHGLTTAAAIWTVAAIGMACGIGFYGEAVVVTVFTLIVLSVLRFIEQRLLPNQARVTIHVHLEPASAQGIFIEQIYDTCRKQGLTVETIHLHHDAQGEQIDTQCRHANVTAVMRALDELREMKDVRTASLDLQELDEFERNRRGGNV